MENASEALNIAFAVLIFVLALSISISSFSLARQTSQTIVELTDREYDYTYVTSSDTTREVGAETIIPTLYRAYKENYIVIFDFKDDSEYVYERKVEGKFEKTNKINLEQEAIGNQEKATLFIDCLLNDEPLEDFFPNLKDLHSNGFYSIIKEKKFREELGIYYIEDIKQNNDNDSSEDITGSFETNESDINKTEKRVITYTEI